MREAAKGALGRSLRFEAVSKRHQRALVDAASEILDLKNLIRKLRLEKGLAVQRAREVKRKRGSEATRRSVRQRGGREDDMLIDNTILIGKGVTAARSLCGLRSHTSLENLYVALNDEGAADNMVFYAAGEEASNKEDGSRVKKHKNIFRGINGLFFALFVLRTGSSLVVASTLFGVHETTGGRAFSTWLNFLCKSLRPYIRLPLADEVGVNAPPNFVRAGLENVAVVLDATEVEVERVWHTDLAHVLYSTHKNKPTAKVLIGVTPGGAICYISNAYGGRLSDADVVKKSGLLEALEERGFGDGGFHAMANRGFNSIAPLLMNLGIHYVHPSNTRRNEGQFAEGDADSPRKVANLRIHVERAIGAIKEWGILHSTFSSKQMDNIPMCFQVCGALVNMMQKPCASEA